MSLTPALLVSVSFNDFYLDVELFSDLLLFLIPENKDLLFVSEAFFVI